MIRKLKFIVSFPFILSATCFPSNAMTVEGGSSTCREVGIILKSEDSQSTGILCQGERFKSKSKVLISCRFKPFLDWLEPGEHEVNRLCPSERLDTRCFQARSCFRNSSRIRLIGNTFASLDLMPTLQWHPVKNAKGYEILIRSSLGDDVRRIQTSEPKYSFSEPLGYGDLYELEIFALDSSYSGRFAFYIPNKEKIGEIKASLSAIQNSALSIKDKALYTDSIYMSFGLLSEAIESLENSTALDQVTELKILLGDRYLEAGYLDKAKAIFEKIYRTVPE